MGLANSLINDIGRHRLSLYISMYRHCKRCIEGTMAKTTARTFRIEPIRSEANREHRFIANMTGADVRLLRAQRHHDPGAAIAVYQARTQTVIAQTIRIAVAG